MIKILNLTIIFIFEIYFHWLEVHKFFLFGWWNLHFVYNWLLIYVEKLNLFNIANSIWFLQESSLIKWRKRYYFLLSLFNIRFLWKVTSSVLALLIILLFLLLTSPMRFIRTYDALSKLLQFFRILLNFNSKTFWCFFFFKCMIKLLNYFLNLLVDMSHHILFHLLHFLIMLIF